MFRKILTATLILSLFTVVYAQAQLRSIPATVTKAFEKKYPAAKNVSWKDKITSFQASFTDNKVATSAWFDSDGSWKQTEIVVLVKNLPSKIKSAITESKYANWTIKDAVKVIKPDDNIFYRVSVSGESFLNKRVLLFSEDGELLRDAQSL